MRKPISVIREAFMNTPIVVTPHIANLISEDDFFIPNGHYAKKYEKKMIDGEIGVINSVVGPRRIIINKPVKAI